MSTSAPSAPQIPALPGQVYQPLALSEEFTRLMNTLQAQQLEQTGFIEQPLTREVDPTSVPGLTRSDRTLLGSVINTAQRIRAGETQFTDEFGRRITIDPQTNQVTFERPGGGVEARLSVDQQLRRTQEVVNQILGRSHADVRFDPTTGALTEQTTELQKTPERLEQEAQLKEYRETSARLYEKQQELVEQAIEDATSPEARTALERQRDLQSRQQDIIEQRLEQQEAALRGDIPPSPALQRAEEEGVQTLKEAAARRGVSITGETLEELTSESTAGQGMIQSLQERLDIAKQQERQAILGQAGIAQTGLGQAGQFALQPFAAGLTPQIGVSPLVATQPGFTGALPQLGAGLPQATQMFGAALSPFMQQQQSTAAMQPPTSGLITPLGAGLAGAGIGASFGPVGAGVGFGAGILGQQFLR